MNLKFKTTARTPHSEEVAIFDADTHDENGKAVNIGKMDMHFVDDQIVGTLLIWQEYATGYARTHGPGSEETMDDVIDQILAEISEPLGVPGEYGVEVYYPSIQNHFFVSNYDEGEEEDDDLGEGVEDGEQTEQTASAQGDDFAKYLKSRN